MPTAPQFTLTATLEDITGIAAGSTANQAKLVIWLCNFGRYLPCIFGNCNMSWISKEFYSQGQMLSIPLWGNDLITPTGTYYAIAVYDGENNCVQAAGYYITGSGTHDLSTLTPIFAIPLPPVPPPALVSYLEIVTSVPPVFHSDIYLAFKYTLTADVVLNSSSFQEGVTGNLYTWAIYQDGAGHHALTWPPGCTNFPTVGQAPSSITIVVGLCIAPNQYLATDVSTYYDPNA